jgi:hypothetical protein
MSNRATLKASGFNPLIEENKTGRQQQWIKKMPQA